jgi:predicted secreted protein
VQNEGNGVLRHTTKKYYHILSYPCDFPEYELLKILAKKVRKR